MMRGGDPTYPGCELTPDEVEFGRAVERYKRAKRRPFPTFSEILQVLRSLGYGKICPMCGGPMAEKTDAT